MGNPSIDFILPLAEKIQQVIADLGKGFGPSFLWTITCGLNSPVTGPLQSAIAIPYQRIGALMEVSVNPKVRHVLEDNTGERITVEFIDSENLKDGAVLILMVIYGEVMKIREERIRTTS